MRKVLLYLSFQFLFFVSFGQNGLLGKFKAYSYSHLSLFAGMSLAKQDISAEQYISRFNYKIAEIENNNFKPGYLLGARWDGQIYKKHDYAITFSINRLATGTAYNKTLMISPFIGEYSYYKAEDKMLNANLTALYKKLITISDTSKFKWYVVAGPSIDVRISNLSEDNLASDAYKRMFMSAKLGVEFNNRSYYTLFFHFKKGLHSITQSPIQTNLDGFELGMFVKASDLF